MKLLITGGYGFIGSNFVRYAINKGYTIFVVDALKIGSNRVNLKDSPHGFVHGDICDLELMKEQVNDVDAVINFAAETHVDRSISNPFSFFRSNAFGTFILLEAIRLSNQSVKLCHISTDEVYGDIIKGSFNENDMLKPSSPYSASKASADMLVLAYVRTYGIDAVITRCSNNYGPYQFPEKLIPKTIIRASKDMKIPVYGIGKNVRDWIYVEDHCKAIDLVLNKGKLLSEAFTDEPHIPHTIIDQSFSGEIYNIASGEEKTNLEVVNTILAIMGKDNDLIEFVKDRPGHDIRYSLDSSKIRKKLGWESSHNFKEGIQKTVDWYLENMDWWKPLADEKVLHPTPWI